MSNTKILETLKLLEEFDMHVHVIAHDDISHLKQFPFAHVLNSEVYVMKDDKIVFLGSRRGVHNFIKNYDKIVFLGSRRGVHNFIKNYDKYNVN